MVPVVSLLALWGFAALTTAQRVSELDDLQDLNATQLAPLHDLVAAVQAERSAAGRYLVSRDVPQDALLAAADQTDAAVTAVRDGVERSSTELADVDPQLPDRITALQDRTTELAELRNDVLNRASTWAESYAAYTATVDQVFTVVGALARVPVGDTTSDPRIVRELALAQEMVARADAAFSAAIAAGAMTADQHRAFAGATHSSQVLLTSSIDDLQPADAAAARGVLDGAPYEQLQQSAAAILAVGSGDAAAVAVPAEEWSETAGTVQQDLATVVANAGVLATADASLFGLDVLGGSGLAVALGLLGVILSLLISVLIGRGLLVELVSLRNSAMDLAGRKLPAALRRLHAGETIDVDAETPPAPGGDDEVTQVAEALTAVHRAALQAAAERAEALSGLSGVYVYLARRSQVLLHRQLALLDTMERRTEDPVELEDLFRLDHLTTRMRRLAESLIILSGAAPARRWRKPVPAIDVIRAAIAEVEDFTRAEVLDVPDVAIAGQAIADLTHLLAELVENAVVFSPPHTKARVRGEVVGSGLAIEVEDRGLGMSREAMAAANRRIQDADQVDLLETDQLGLFVVNRLAHRQHVKVTMQPSPYGGVTAIVLLPEQLIDHSRVRRDELQPDSSGPDLPRRLPAITPEAEPAIATEGVFEPVSAATAELSPVPASPTTADTGEVAELPRRVRRAHLVPELRNGPRATPPPPRPDQSGGLDRRTPEQARATLSAMRTGWLRGQTDEADESEQGRHH